MNEHVGEVLSADDDKYTTPAFANGTADTTPGTGGDSAAFIGVGVGVEIKPRPSAAAA